MNIPDNIKKEMYRQIFEQFQSDEPATSVEDTVSHKLSAIKKLVTLINIYH